MGGWVSENVSEGVGVCACMRARAPTCFTLPSTVSVRALLRPMALKLDTLTQNAVKPLRAAQKRSRPTPPAAADRATWHEGCFLVCVRGVISANSKPTVFDLV